jgi:hypothetical protein
MKKRKLIKIRVVNEDRWESFCLGAFFLLVMAAMIFQKQVIWQPMVVVYKYLKEVM